MRIFPVYLRCKGLLYLFIPELLTEPQLFRIRVAPMAELPVKIFMFSFRYLR
jgi:hypothetical protein